MNFMRLHLGDWATRLDEYSVAVEGTYLRMLRWCYVHECPLPLDMRRICDIVHAHTKADRMLVKLVLDTFFEARADGFHNDRTDMEVVRSHINSDENSVKRLIAQHRQQRCRQRRHTMWTALRDAGIDAPLNYTTLQLAELCTTHHVTVHVTRDGRDGHPAHSYPEPRTLASLAAGADAPVRAREGPDLEPVPTPAPSAPGLACKAMRQAGLPDVNPSHPLLLRLLDAGVSADELRLAAAEAATKGKGFAYALAVVEGRRKDAQKAGAVPSPGNSVSQFLAAIRKGREADA